MRKLLISLMAAGMFVAAAAPAEDGPVRRAMRNHAERSSQRDENNDNSLSRSQPVQRANRSGSDRPVRVERAPREDRGSRNERVPRVARADDGNRDVQRVERVRRVDRDGQRVSDVRRDNRDVQQVEQVQVNEPVRPVGDAGRRREDTAGYAREAGSDSADVRTAGRDGRRDGDGDRDGRDGRRDRDGDGDRRDWRRDGGRDRDGGDWRRDGRPDGDRDGRDWRRDGDGRHRWDRDWRRDRRYDWARYRYSYGSLFRLGRYYDPYGWGYRRFYTGFSLWPSYYGSSFWLNDPWQYRLPPAYGPYRWIRYFDDALLVNIYTGEVVDVIHNMFW